MRRFQIAVLCGLVGCARVSPAAPRMRPDPECTSLAGPLQAIAPAAAVHITSCSAELLAVRFESATRSDSEQLAAPTEELAHLVWDAAGRRAAHVAVTIGFTRGFGAMECYGTRPWRLNPGCRIPDALPLQARTDVRVRLWDERTGRYVRTSFSLEKPDGWTESFFVTGADATGWGESFWLPPGRYTIVITDLPCGREHYFLKHALTRAFVAKAGVAVDLTFRVHSGAVQMMKSYNNPDGRSCTDEPRAQPS